MRKIRLNFAFAAMVLFSGIFPLTAQVAINTDGSAATSSAMLDVSSSDKGMLVPRMTQTQRDAISGPALGLLIYQTDVTQGFYYYNGSSWIALLTGTTGVTSVTGTANRISIGGTVSAPIVDVAATYVGQNSITTLGTIGTGTWNGTRIGLAYGGTNSNLSTGAAIGDLLYANSTTTFARLADIATGNALLSRGVGVAPSWGKIGLTTHVTGTLPVANGGTGAITFTAGQVLFGNGTSAVNASANFFWDNTNRRLGINTATPNSSLQVVGSVSMPVTTSAAASYTVIATDYTILCNAGTMTVYLPTAVGNIGRQYVIKKISAAAGTITVRSVVGTQTIDGATTNTFINARWRSLIVQSDGANWFILANNN
jgi:hypothetical protein